LAGKYKGARKGVRRLLAAVVAIAIILAAGILGRHSEQKGPRGGTDEQRLAFLASLGWEAEGTPETQRTIRLPEEFPEVLKNYNELQKQQGFDLEKYAGKEVTMVVYPLRNYPDVTDEVLCSLYIYRGRIIGGDIHSTAFDGFMRSLR